MIYFELCDRSYRKQKNLTRLSAVVAGYRQSWLHRVEAPKLSLKDGEEFIGETHDTGETVTPLRQLACKS